MSAKAYVIGNYGSEVYSDRTLLTIRVNEDPERKEDGKVLIDLDVVALCTWFKLA